MMIKSSLHLIFVLLYKSTYLWSEPEKSENFGGCFVLFNELLILPLFNLFFVGKFSCDRRKWGLFCSYFGPVKACNIYLRLIAYSH